MNCDQIQEHLSEYLDKRLDDPRRRIIEDHLVSCPLCLSEVKQLSDGIKGVRGLPEGEPPAGFSQQVMARIRTEAEKPTPWERLFRPFRIKIPLHATALLLVVGLAVYLYRANEPIQTERALSVPTEAASPLKRPPPSDPEPAEAPPKAFAPAGVPPSAPPEAERLQENKIAAREAGRLESSDSRDRALMARAPKQETAQESKSETNPLAGAPLSDSAGSRPTAEAPLKKAQLSAPDIVLTLITNAPPDKKEELTARVNEIVARSGGTIHPAAEKDDREEARPHFLLDLPKSEYSRFKTELAQIGEIISESQRSPNAPPSGRKPSSTMQIELTFLPEKPKENAPAAPPHPN
ncbi:MAG: DUF2275 domain-containing protein [Candidatus Manganitrophaceae bacterium]|nr:MAG: DUF2275 domain-containing protein [Candidatus Manganitrophaceae bacterium]